LNKTKGCLIANFATVPCNWISATMKNPKPTQVQSKNPSKQDYQALERQLRAAQKELELRKREIEFLKKASAYFASLKP
jgi:transposase